MSKQTQCNRIVEWCREHKTVTRAIAGNELAIYELSSRIGELEQKGYVFDKERCRGRNKYGEIVPYVKYTLVGEPNV